MDDDAVAIGQRVRYWRLRRQLSRKQFADVVGRSTSWLDKIEKGERNLLRLPMLEQVAHALAVDPSVLLNNDVARRAESGPDAVEVRAIRAALGHYPALVARKQQSEPVSAPGVDRQLSYAGHAWLSAHYATVAQAVPRLIRDAQTFASQAEDGHRVAANRALVMAYRLACSTLLKYDATESAWLAADRAMHAAEAIDDTIALARATRSVSRAMSHSGQPNEAMAVCIDMADVLRPDLSRSDSDTVPLFGMLLLSAEITAATQGDGVLARGLHDEATAATLRLGPTHHQHHTVFGLANVEVHRVSALVRLHEAAHAIHHAERLDPALLAALPPERRACYLLDVADANAQLGHAQQAVTALHQAERLAPEEIRSRPVAHRMIAHLLSTRRGGADPMLRQLAQRAGVAA